jgi:hypothetical protein
MDRDDFWVLENKWSIKARVFQPECEMSVWKKAVTIQELYRLLIVA